MLRGRDNIVGVGDMVRVREPFSKLQNWVGAAVVPFRTQRSPSFWLMKLRRRLHAQHNSSRRPYSCEPGAPCAKATHAWAAHPSSYRSTHDEL